VRGFHDWLISAQVRVGTGVGRISRILGVSRVSVRALGLGTVGPGPMGPGPVGPRKVQKVTKVFKKYKKRWQSQSGGHNFEKNNSKKPCTSKNTKSLTADLNSITFEK